MNLKHWTFIEKTPGFGDAYKHNKRNVTMILYHKVIKLFVGDISPFREPLLRNRK